MRHALAATICLLCLPSCKVVDAPDSLEEIVVFGFVNLQDRAAIQAVADELPVMAKRNAEELAEGYRVDRLGRKDLVEAGVDVGKMDPIVGAMGQVRYHNDLPDVLDVISHRRKATVQDNVEEYEILEDSDRACFLARECDSYTVTARQVTKQPIIGNLTQEFTQEFVWVEHEGQEAVAARMLTPDPIDVSSGLAAIDQQYNFYLVRQLPRGGVERTEAMWAEARLLGADLPDSFLVDTAVKAMANQAEMVDDWIDANR